MLLLASWLKLTLCVGRPFPCTLYTYLAHLALKDLLELTVIRSYSYVVIGGTVLGAGWYISRLARGPSVVWDRKNNPTPVSFVLCYGNGQTLTSHFTQWLDVDKNAQTKVCRLLEPTLRTVV